jgi:glycosyltransferase involved in cell wall biosynthesis
MTDFRRPLRVAFLHPDLGIGGAERLVVDAATALLRRGHRAEFFTSRFDPPRAFPEVRGEGVPVHLHGGGVPSSLGGRLRAPSTILRMALCARAAAAGPEPWDAVVCDLASHVVPLARRLSGAPVIFYGHYPDLLLAPPAGGFLSLYRRPIHQAEERGLLAADRILVNSRHTAGIFRRVFPSLAGRELEILHPGVEVPAPPPPPLPGDSGLPPPPFLLSLNRFVPGKNLPLAVATLSALRSLDPDLYRRLSLVVAGSFDPRLPESRATLSLLRDLAVRGDLAGKVTIRPSVDEAERRWLLGNCLALLYTAPEEHFGIGIVEAMAAGRPVVAVNRGGPLEIVEEGRSGFLREPDATAFALAVREIAADPRRGAALGEAGMRRARDHFSRDAFGETFEGIVRQVAASR